MTVMVSETGAGEQRFQDTAPSDLIKNKQTNPRCLSVLKGDLHSDISLEICDRNIGN